MNNADRIREFFAQRQAANGGLTMADRVRLMAGRKAVVGSRISLVHMGGDPNPIMPGTLGTVEYIDDIQVMVKWDNGRTLNLALPEDKYLVID